MWHCWDWGSDWGSESQTVNSFKSIANWRRLERIQVGLIQMPNSLRWEAKLVLRDCCIIWEQFPPTSWRHCRGCRYTAIGQIAGALVTFYIAVTFYLSKLVTLKPVKAHLPPAMVSSPPPTTSLRADPPENPPPDPPPYPPEQNVEFWKLQVPSYCVLVCQVDKYCLSDIFSLILVKP